MKGGQGTHCRSGGSDLSLQVTPESHPATGWLFFFPDGIWISSSLAYLLCARAIRKSNVAKASRCLATRCKDDTPNSAWRGQRAIGLGPLAIRARLHVGAPFHGSLKPRCHDLRRREPAAPSFDHEHGDREALANARLPERVCALEAQNLGRCRCAQERAVLLQQPTLRGRSRIAVNHALSAHRLATGDRIASAFESQVPVYQR